MVVLHEESKWKFLYLHISKYCVMKKYMILLVASINKINNRAITLTFLFFHFLYSTCKLKFMIFSSQ